MLEELNTLRRQFADHADFLLVYIAEAHASDEWPIGSDLIFDQPKTLDERHKIVNKFIENTKFEWPIVLDNIDNHFDNIYAAWPLRFYIINGSQIDFIANPQDGGYYELPKLHKAILSAINNSK